MAGIRLTSAQRNIEWGMAGRVPVKNVKHLLPWPVDQQVWCHRDIADQFLAACNEAAEQSSWTPKRIDSYVVRKIRGSSEWSIHSWALAWDIFSTGPTVPPPGGVWHPTDSPPEAFGHCFERHGFTWGKRFNRVDYPHQEEPGHKPGGSPPPPPPHPPPSSGGFLSEAAENMMKEVHAMVVTGINPRLGDETFLARLGQRVEKLESATFKGAPDFGVDSIVGAVTKTNFSVAGVDPDASGPGDSIRDFIRDEIANQLEQLLADIKAS